LDYPPVAREKQNSLTTKNGGPIKIHDNGNLGNITSPLLDRGKTKTRNLTKIILS
ncbi:hypothetical protein S83_042568, partial [Arachis hypogaea]